jgi:hypothetical protein
MRRDFSVLSARTAGYEVYVVGHACGGLTPLSHDLATRRMEAAGPKPTSWIQVLPELQLDWSGCRSYRETLPRDGSKMARSSLGSVYMA